MKPTSTEYVSMLSSCHSYLKHQVRAIKRINTIPSGSHSEMHNMRHLYKFSGFSGYFVRKEHQHNVSSIYVWNCMTQQCAFRLCSVVTGQGVYFRCDNSLRISSKVSGEKIFWRAAVFTDEMSEISGKKSETKTEKIMPDSPFLVSRESTVHVFAPM